VVREERSRLRRKENTPTPRIKTQSTGLGHHFWDETYYKKGGGVWRGERGKLPFAQDTEGEAP